MLRCLHGIIGTSHKKKIPAFSCVFNAFSEHISESCIMLRPPGVEESCQENYPKVRLTRAQYDFDVLVPKISTPRFSKTVISVDYFTTVRIYRHGHQSLNSHKKVSLFLKTTFKSYRARVNLTFEKFS